MRVGYVLKRYPRYSETFIVAELLAHQAAGLDVEIFGLRHPNEPRRQPEVDRIRFPVTYLGSEPGSPARETEQIAELTRLIETRGIDLLHAHFATSATVVAQAAAAATGIPYTVTAHAKDIYHEEVDPSALRHRLGGAAKVITVSDFNRDYLTTTLGIAADRVIRIYNGLDLDAHPAQLDGRRNGRILAVGRLVSKKGFGVLIDAVARLRDRGERVGCDLVGTGPLDADLRHQAQTLGLDHQVVFHGALPRDQVAAMMRTTGVFAAPCLISDDGDRDGLPTVLLEAMASGAPTIATPVTGIPEIVHHRQTGILVSERDSDGLADALISLLDHPAAGLALARRARALIERDFDQTSTAGLLRSVFHTAVTAPFVPAGALRCE